MAKATRAMTITLPVELKTQITNLQQQADEYRKALERVDPGSALGKKINRALDSIQGKLETVTAKAERPFHSSKQIDSLADQVDKIGDSVQKVGVQFNNLKFKDLLLDPEQAEQFEVLTGKIEIAKKELNDFYKTQTKKMRSTGSANSEFFKGAGVVSSDSAEKIVEKVNAAVAALRENVEATATQLEEALNQEKAVRTQINTRRENRQSLADKVAGSSSDFFKSNGRFTTGKNKSGKQALLRQMFENGFSQEEIDSVRKMTAEQVHKFFLALKTSIKNEATSPELLKAQTDAEAQTDRAQRANTEAQMRLENGERIQSQVNDIANAPEIKEARQELEGYNTDLQNLENNAVNAAKGSEKVKKATDDFNNALEGAGNGVREVSAAMQQLEQRQQALSNIQMAVSHWFGFTQVVNMVKSAVKGMITEIKGLDEVITQIAVVTDMTQKDLWAQMDTYSALAQKYGTTIKGVYQVSQLYYQLLVA